MRHAQQIADLLADMTSDEKKELFHQVARELTGDFPGIDSSPDVCGGAARLVRTRIPIWVLVQTRRLGASEADLLRAYPQLLAEDLAHAWAYSEAHPQEIDRYIRENEAA